MLSPWLELQQFLQILLLFFKPFEVELLLSFDFSLNQINIQVLVGSFALFDLREIHFWDSGIVGIDVDCVFCKVCFCCAFGAFGSEPLEEVFSVDIDGDVLVVR